MKKQPLVMRANGNTVRDLWNMPSSLLLSALMVVASATMAQAQPLTFDAAIQQAMGESPDVAARTIQVEAARSAAIPAGALPDPKLFVGLNNYPITGPNQLTFGEEMTMATVGLMQDFPNGDKRRARVARAQAEVGMAQAELIAHHREVALAAAVAWLDVSYLERRIAALVPLEAENRLLAETVAPRIASGTATPADAVAPGLEEASLADRRADLVAESTGARAELRRWIGAAADQPIAESVPTFAIDPMSLRASLESHPAMRMYESAMARAGAETQEAEAAKWPDFELQAGAHYREPQFGWMVSAQVTIDLPLFASTRQNPLIAAKVLQADRIRLERDGVQRRLVAELERDLAVYAVANEKLGRVRATTLPLARRKDELQLASYRAGTAAFDAVLAARRERIETELASIELEAEAAKVAARLAIYFGGIVP